MLLMRSYFVVNTAASTRWLSAGDWKPRVLSMAIFIDVVLCIILLWLGLDTVHVTSTFHWQIQETHLVWTDPTHQCIKLPCIMLSWQNIIPRSPALPLDLTRDFYVPVLSLDLPLLFIRALECNVRDTSDAECCTCCVLKSMLCYWWILP